MNKTELQEAIKNKESVWEYRNYEIREINLKTMYPEMLNDYQLSYIVDNNGNETMYFTSIEYIYKTKAEAEHYLNHANITRIETLPFLTWEEFLKEKEMKFTSKDNKDLLFFIIDAKSMVLDSEYETLNRWDLNEKNFYLAYDYCVKLFKGE